MSALDLTEAVEAAARSLAHEAGLPAWDDMAPMSRHDLAEAVLPSISAAAPLIERQVREQVAREIEAQVVRDDFGRVNTFGMGEQHAARVARGGAR